jgi:hypothetical protein
LPVVAPHAAQAITGEAGYWSKFDFVLAIKAGRTEMGLEKMREIIDDLLEQPERQQFAD